MKATEQRGADTGGRSRLPDAHGQAALLLTESLLHVLVEGGRLTLDEAISAAESAQEAAMELCKDVDATPQASAEALDILGRVVRSLGRDLIA